MKDLVEYIVKGLVSNPDAVMINEQNNKGDVLLLLSVDPKDMGVVIGRSGQTIKAIRKILTVRAIAEGIKVNLQLNEPEGYSRESIEETPDNQDNTHQTKLEGPADIASESDAQSEE